MVSRAANRGSPPKLDNHFREGVNMFTLIKKVLQGGHKPQARPAERELQKRIAACVLLLEAAHIDDECTPEEMAFIVDTVQARYALSPEYAAELLELAGQERQNSVDLWQFTNDLNQQHSPAERQMILEDVWRIIFADGRLEMHEDQLAHKLANLLRLSHQEMIAAKLAAKANGGNGTPPPLPAP